MPPTLADDLATRSQTLGQTLISNLSRWYADGVFYQAPANVWYLSTLAPACLLATLSKYTTNETLRDSYIDMCVEIVNRVCEQNVNTDGVFTAGAGGVAAVGPDPPSMGTVFTDTAAIEATSSIGWILLQLPEDRIPMRTKARWLAVCQANCDWMDTRSLDTVYYINGNFNVHLLNAYWFTAAASNAVDRPTYEDMYERALAFIMAPTPLATWAGYGFTIDTSGGPASDWSDRLAHLTETPGYVGPNPTPNFDPYYSTLQLDLLARLFLVNRDYRISQLMNAISNKMEPLINTSTWVIDCTGGSRQNITQGYVMGWLQVSSLLACKKLNTTLLSSVNVLAAWDTQVIPSLSGNTTVGTTAAGTMRQLALCVATTREAANVAQLKVTTT